MEPDSRPARPVVLVATALASDAHGRIPLVKNMGSWWLPGGRVEPGESFVDAAVRETEEETSLRFAPDGIVHIAQHWKRDRHVVYATVKGVVVGELAAPEDDPKIDAARWVTVDEVVALVAGYGALWRELLDAPTITETMETGA